MLGSNDNVVGSAAVEVRGDLSQLEADLANGKKATEKFVNDAGKMRAKDFAGQQAAAKGAANSNKQLEKSLNDLTKAYKPAEAAALKFQKQLEKIQALKGAGMIGPNTAKDLAKSAEKEFLAAARGAEQTAKWTTKAGEEIRKMATLAVTAGVVALVAMAKSSLETAENIQNLSNKIGMSAEEVQRWHFVAEKTGVDAAAIDQAFEQLAQSSGKAAAGAELQKKAFTTLGVSLKDANGHAKSVAQLMPELADALARVGDAQQRAAVAQVLFGRSAQDILPALAAGSRGINELSEAADRLGVVLSNEEIRNLAATNQKLNDLKMVLSADVSHTVAQNADSIITLAHALAELVGWLVKAGAAYVTFWDKVGRGIGMMIQDPRSIVGLGKAGGGGNNNQQDVASPEDRMALAKMLAGVGGKNINASGFLTPKGPKGSDPHREQEFQSQLAQLESQLLQTLAQRVTNADEAAKIQLRLLDIEKARFTATLAADLKDKKFTAAEGALLKTKFAELDAEKRRQVELDRQEKLLQDRTAAETASLENDRDYANVEQQLARSTKERRRLALELLDLDEKLENARLDAVIASTESTDVEKQIARERKAHLAALKELQKDVIERETQGPVADFFDSIRMSADELDDAIAKIRAAHLDEQRQRAVQFADDVGTAFGNMADKIMHLKSPLEILEGLLTDLASTFTQEFATKPLQDWARRAIGGPVAEKLIGAPAGQEGLWMGTLEASGLKAATQLDMLALAATRAQQGFSVTLDQGIDPLGAASADAAQNIGDQTAAVNQFASGLLSIFSGGGGGGGFLQGALGLAGSLFGGGGGLGRLVSSAAANIAANPGIFDSGGEVGPSGRPIRRKPSNVDITAEVGEYLIPRGPARTFRSQLDQIRAGRTPDFGAGMMRLGGGSNSTHVQIGDIVFPGITDERSARRAGRQVAADISGRVARAAKTGLVRNDR